jgi:hypothetical protein
LHERVISIENDIIGERGGRSKNDLVTNPPEQSSKAKWQRVPKRQLPKIMYQFMFTAWAIEDCHW